MVVRIGHVLLIKNSTLFYIPFNNLVRKVDYQNSMNCDKLVVHIDGEDLYASALPNGRAFRHSDWKATISGHPKAQIRRFSRLVEKLKQWLSQNPITVQYELATESVKTVDSSIVDQDDNTTDNLHTFDTTTQHQLIN